MSSSINPDVLEATLTHWIQTGMNTPDVTVTDPEACSEDFAICAINGGELAPGEMLSGSSLLYFTAGYTVAFRLIAAISKDPFAVDHRAVRRVFAEALKLVQGAAEVATSDVACDPRRSASAAVDSAINIVRSATLDGEDDDDDGGAKD